MQNLTNRINELSTTMLSNSREEHEQKMREELVLGDAQSFVWYAIDKSIPQVTTMLFVCDSSVIIATANEQRADVHFTHIELVGGETTLTNVEIHKSKLAKLGDIMRSKKDEKRDFITLNELACRTLKHSAAPAHAQRVVADASQRARDLRAVETHQAIRETRPTTHRDELSAGVAYAQSANGQYMTQRAQKYTTQRDERREQSVSVNVGTTIPDATFTIEYNDGRPHRTLKITTQASDASFAPGQRIVAFLSGSDNDNDFTSFAFLNERGYVNFWKKFVARHSDDVTDSLVEALQVLGDDPKKAGLAYALLSSRCCKCNRKLTVPASIHSGMGPECASKAGW